MKRVLSRLAVRLLHALALQNAGIRGLHRTAISMQANRPARQRRASWAACSNAVAGALIFGSAIQQWRPRGRAALAALAIGALMSLAGCGGASSSADENAGGSSSDGRAHAMRAVIGAPQAITAGDVSQSIYTESGKLIRADENVATLGSDLFGDSVNLYDGSTSFVQTDVSLPGNSTLPVSVGRRLTTGNAHLVSGHFGDWDLEIPRLHGVFAASTGWKVGPGVASSTTARCTQFAAPPQVYGQSNQGLFNPEEYWHGSFIYVPGHGSQEILRANTTTAAIQPTGSLANSVVTPIKLTTKNRWAFVCGTPIQNGGGEGFTAISPDGTKYRFDWLVSRPYPQIERAEPFPEWRAGAAPPSDTQKSGVPGTNLYAGYLLKRNEVWILPTQITDRFGNQVTYTYSGWRLMAINSIESSGATRTITFEYQEDPINSRLVSRISDGSRSWTYGYTNRVIGGIQYGKVLTSVTLPADQTTSGGAWTIDMANVSNPQNDTSGGGGTCDSVPPNGVVAGTGTMIHPSGAKGSFRFAPVLNGRSYVWRNCRGNDADNNGWAMSPRYFVSYALQSKTLSGPGLPAVDLSLPNPGGYTWMYSYGPDNASWSTCSGCPDTKTVTVTGPLTARPGLAAQTVQTRYIFGNRWQVTDGQLLQVEEGWSGTAPERTTTNQYAAPTLGPYPQTIGASLQLRTAGDLSTRHAPMKRRTIVQQAVTFKWEANESKFDKLARPTEVTKSSTLGHSRTEATVYGDITNGQADPFFTDKWVLGAVKAVNHLSGAGGSFVKEIEGHDYDATTLKPSNNRVFGRLDQTFTYHGDGNLWTRADGLGHITTFTNYKFGVSQDVTYADDTNEHADVNGIGLITLVRNGAGTQTQYAYDVVGRLKTITPPPEPGMPYNSTVLAFDQVGSDEVGLPAGHWRQTVVTGDAKTERFFDALWRPLLTRTWDTGSTADTSRAVLKSFDWANRPTFESYPVRTSQLPSIASSVAGTRRFYEPLGRPLRIEQDSELGSLATQFAYGTNFTRATTTPRGHVTTALFQVFDAPKESTLASLALPEGVSVGIGRDEFGKANTISRAGGGKIATRSYVYDSYQRLCKTIEPETGATIQQLDLAGNVTWRASGLTLTNQSCDQARVPAGKKVNYTYDPRNRLLNTTYGDGSQSITRGYTGDGLLSSIGTSGAGVNPITWAYSYNNRRLLTRERYTWGDPNNWWDFTWGRDAYGHVASLSDPWGIVYYSPDALGRPTQVSDYASGVSYHPNGAVAGYTLDNGIAHVMTQNARGLPEVMQDGSVVRDRYAYDANGNVTSITDEAQAGANSRSMTLYDGLDRLRQASGPWGAGSFSYDALDNMTGSTVGGRSLTHQIDPGTNRLTSLSGNLNLGIGYDANGNVAQRGSQGFVFDIANRMTSATGKVSYAYDGHGRRNLVWFAGGGYMHQAYTQDGKLRFAWRNSEGHTRHVYLGDKLIAETAEGSITTFSHTDALGSPVARTNSSGGLVSRTRYEPYGATVAGSTDPTKIGFTGHVNDPDTGLVYMQQRYYDPIAGRFLSVDPVTTDANSGKSFNRYKYASNNPYSFTDPDGRDEVPFLQQCSGNCQVLVGGPGAAILAGANANIAVQVSSAARGVGKAIRAGARPAIGMLRFTPLGMAAGNLLSEGANSEGGGQRTVDDLIGESTAGSETKGRADQYIHGGGREQRDKDFDSLGATDVKDRGNGTRTGTLPDGRPVNVHDSKTDGVPTIQIGNGSREIKIRYP